MKGAASGLLLVAVFLAVIAIYFSVYVVDERQQVIITEFGAPKGDPVTTPGLKFKLPWRKVQSFDKRFLEWDGDRNQLPTKDKRFIFVDTYARWRITDPLKFYIRLRDQNSAQSRLDDILDGETRNTIARHNLIEAVRTSNRKFEHVSELGDESTAEDISPPIEFGRAVLEAEVLAAAQGRVSDLGIEVLDFRFKRLNYVPEVRREVFARMISERKRIAEQFRSEGEGESARINGERERELKRITSEAYLTSQEIKGRADGAAGDIFASAYNRDPEFYRFLKTMDVYKSTLDKQTVLILGTDGELMRYLESSK